MSWDPRSVAVVEGRPAVASYPPHPALRASVSMYWTIDVDEGDVVLRTLADASVDVTIDHAQEPRAYVSAPGKAARTLHLRAPHHLVGARLQPGAAQTLGVDLEALREGRRPLGDFIDPAVADRLARDVAAAPGIAPRLAALDMFFERALCTSIDPRVARALEAVFGAQGDVSVAELARLSGAHARTLARLFEAAVGVGPKRFARIVRVQAAMRAAKQSDLADVAARLGYADQAHFTREVTELFGAPPRALLADR